MKSFSVLFVVLMAIVTVNAITEEQKKLAQEHVKKCKAEIGIDTDVAFKVRAGSFASDTDNRKAKCFVECFFKETGFMNSAGQPQRDVIINKLVDRHGFEKDAITKLVDICLKEKGSDNCETAYKIFQCYRTNSTVRDKFNSYKLKSSPAAVATSPAVVSSTPSNLVPKNNVVNIAAGK